ncbi:transporter integral membrane protein [Asanoa ishikariensis]|uniref:Carbohydrate ABC transporter membrane protein 1, CUT1 family n=1 Tax=Asanoa ishikariensis TaxID=137265 RepID=A0A1H3NHH8_9ACTN|nr:sugar ABC transporter permease [Asanoa ishikariensis]GIF68612.1 transporter integral membrane protein [Asanoa ishikariensis]SDY88342.1 carbohydrate ABC transporter membrane protein 1, CUT1 family [Asanoa ishikariensis]
MTTLRVGKPHKARSDKLTIYLLLLPSLLPVLLLSVFPLLRGIYLGFTDARAGRNVDVTFTGFENYKELLGDEMFWNSFKIGLIWALGVTVLQFVLALGLALLLNQQLRFRGVARVLSVVPWAMPPVVVGILWKLVYHPDAGLLNEFFHRIGADGLRANWLGDFSTALPAVIIVGVWAGMPQTTVVLLAGLQGVAPELHEAAAVDGASAWHRFRHVTLPALAPVIVAITSLDFIWNFNSFGLVYVLTAGGPGGKTMLPMLFAYEEAFRYGNYGYAAALGNVMVVIIVALLAIYLRRRLREAN